MTGTFLPDRLVENPIVDPSNGRMTFAFKKLIDQVAQQGSNAAASVPQLVTGTHTQRLDDFDARKLPPGSIFYETDRTLYYLNIGGVWTYLAGVCQVTQSNLPTDLATQSAADDGVLVWVTDYAHLLTWNHNLLLSGAASGWTWGPGEEGSGFTSDFTDSPFAGPDDATGWIPAQGQQQVLTLKSDGTLHFATLRNLAAGFWFRQ